MAYINGKEILFDAVVNENTGITPTGEIEITTNGPHNVKEFETAIVNVPEKEPNLQSKSIEINENKSVVVNSDEGFDGLSEVALNVNVPITQHDIGIVINGLSAQNTPNDITFYGEAPKLFFYKNEKITKITFENCSEVGESICEDSNVETVVIPDSVTKINVGSFYLCSNLAHINIPSALTFVGGSAFNQCKKLNIPHLILPKDVDFIGDSAFNYCSLIKTVTFMGKPRDIASTAFTNSGVTTINVPWASGEVAGAPWGATKATINYNYTGE